MSPNALSADALLARIDALVLVQCSKEIQPFGGEVVFTCIELGLSIDRKQMKQITPILILMN